MSSTATAFSIWFTSFHHRHLSAPARERAKSMYCAAGNTRENVIEHPQSRARVPQAEQESQRTCEPGAVRGRYLHRGTVGEQCQPVAQGVAHMHDLGQVP